MSLFWNLVKFEYRKLLKRKMVCISIGICMTICIMIVCVGLVGTYDIDGEPFDTNYNMLITDQAYARNLSGREIDDTLIQFVQEAYTKLPNVPMYTATQEYQTYARPYSEIRNYVINIVGVNKFQSITEEELYIAREKAIEEEWKSLDLTEGETVYLQELEEEVITPVIYQYTDGYQRGIAMLFIVLIMLYLLITICVPSVFSEEYSRKTDQLIMSCKFGRKHIYCAKTLMVCTFSLTITVLLLLSLLIPIFLIYGVDGFRGSAQLLLPYSSWNLTVGGMLIALIIMLLITALLLCGAAVFLTECFKNNSITILIMVGFLLLFMVFNVPVEYRVLSQIWECNPLYAVSVKGAFQSRLFPLGNTYLTFWQVIPIMYTFLSTIMLILGYQLYRKYQIGR